MRLSFGEHTLELKKWDSENEMRAALSGMDGCVILGDNAREVYSTEVRIGFGGASRLGIGLLSWGLGIHPHVRPLPGRSELLFGLNREAVCVSIETKSVRFRVPLDSPFRCFLSAPGHGLTLIFHEIGVLGVDERGGTKWEYSRDVIDDCRIRDACLELDFLDAPSVRLSLIDGACLSLE